MCNAGGAAGITDVTCNAGFYETGSAISNNLGCTACTNQAHCEVSTANTCSTTASFTTKTSCTSVTEDGYYLDGDIVKACAAVADSTSRTCNAGGAAGITDVTCSSGFYKTGSAGSNNLGCSACEANYASCSDATTCTACTPPEYEELSANTVCPAGLEICTFEECIRAVNVGRTVATSDNYNECFGGLKFTCAWKNTQNHVLFNTCSATSGSGASYLNPVCYRDTSLYFLKSGNCVTSTNCGNGYFADNCS